MNIVQLDLLAFGPFTGATITFGAGTAGLHIVYGENEAGKSSSLRALKQLLYGIPRTSADNFVHAYGDLRIGATLRRRDGRTVQVIRRKSQKHALRGADDEQVVEAQVLEEILGRRDLATFERRHGIDHDELVAGGKAVGEGKGDLAELLFAAGSGVADVNRIQLQLNSEVDELFTPRAQTRRINKSLDELKKLREVAATSRVRTADWTLLRDELRADRDAEVQVVAELADTRGRYERLSRLKMALPSVVRQRDLLAELDGLTDAPRLAVDAAELRQKLVTQLRVSEHAAQRCAEELGVVERQLKEFPPASPLYERAEHVEACNQQLGSYKKAAKDRVGLDSRRTALLDDVSRTARDFLGHAATIAEITAIGQRPAPRLGVRKLGRSLDQLATRRGELAKQLADHVQRRHDAERQLQDIGPSPDTTEFERVLRRARKEVAQQEREQSRRADAATARTRATSALARLGGWTASLEELLAAPLPTPETVEHWHKVLREQAEAVERLERERERHIAQRGRVTIELAHLDEGFAVPTEAHLSAARARRERGWRLIRALWEKQEAPDDTSDSYLDESPGATTLGEAYTLAVAQADQIVDRMRHEADRVAHKSTLQLRRAQVDHDVTAAEEQLAAARGAEQASLEAWRAIWKRHNVVPQLPAEMRGWLTRVSQIGQEIAVAEQAEAEASVLAERVAAQRQQVLVAWKQCAAERPLPESTSLAELLDDADERLQRWRDAAQRAEGLRNQIEQLASQTERTRSELQDVLRQQDELAGPWREEMTRLSLPSTATPDEAEEQLRGIEKIQEGLREMEQLDERMRGIDREAEDFSRVVHELVAQAGFAHEGWPVDFAPTEMMKRLKAEHEREARRAALHKERARLEKDCRSQRSKCDEARIAVEQLCREASVLTVEELPAAEHRSARRRAVEAELREIDKHLLPLASGEAVARFAEQVLAQDQLQLAAELSTLESDIADKDRRRNELAAQIAVLESRAQQLDQSAGAVEAEFAIQQLVARLQVDARDYARKKLAAVLLRRAMERYRERGQGPLVRRASELFAELTLGSFAGLRAEFDDDGRPVLIGVRPGRNRTTPIEGMSTGTRDQLYLALRLASLEEDFRGQEPLPFIVDDILIQFDDARAAGALRVLARIAERVQVIFFTHHAHLRNIARTTLDDQAYCVHELRRADSAIGLSEPTTEKENR